MPLVDDELVFNKTVLIAWRDMRIRSLIRHEVRAFHLIFARSVD